MHEMRTVATDNHVAWSVCLSVYKTSVPCKTVMFIEVRFGAEHPGGPGSIVLYGVLDFLTDSMRPSPNNFGYLFHFLARFILIF